MASTRKSISFAVGGLLLAGGLNAGCESPSPMMTNPIPLPEERIVQPEQGDKTESTDKKDDKKKNNTPPEKKLEPSTKDKNLIYVNPGPTKPPARIPNPAGKKNP